MAYELKNAFGKWLIGIALVCFAAFFVGMPDPDEGDDTTDHTRSLKLPEGTLNVVVHTPVQAAENEGGMPLELVELVAQGLGADLPRVIELYHEWAREAGEAAVVDAASRVALLKSEQILTAAFGGWMAEDAEAAKDFVLEADVAKWRRAQFATALYHSMADEDRMVQAGWVGQFPEDSRLHSELAIAWVAEEPEKAVRWLLSGDPNKGREAGLMAAMRNWTNADPESASVFIVDMKNGRERDLAVQAMVAVIASTDHQSAKTWAETISDETMRERILKSLSVILADSEGVMDLTPR